MTAERYTESQVLCGLREVVEGITGSSNSFDANTQIVAYFKARGVLKYIDFADVLDMLKAFFGFECSDKEWAEFFGSETSQRSVDEWHRTVAPRLTFGALARFIADRAPALASFDAVEVLGSWSASAGVFYGLRRLAGRQFAPSDRIDDVLRGREFERFWARLRWMTEGSIVPLPGFWCLMCFLSNPWCWLWIGVAGGVTALVATGDPIWLVPVVAVALILYAFASVYSRVTKPLPPTIMTFRDLASVIARSRVAPSGL